MILAGDVGGTKTNLGAFERDGAGLRQLHGQRYQNRELGSFVEMLRAFLAELEPGTQWEAACFGVAGPVVNRRVHMINLPWEVDAAAVGKLLGTKQIRLLNDMEATFAGIDAIEPNDLFPLQAGMPVPGGNQALVAAGTGIGESFRVWVGKSYQVIASEGGHADFAPRTDEEIELLRYLKKTHAWVEVEQVISGRGFRILHEFLGPSVDHPDFHEPGVDAAAEITQRAMHGGCSICSAAVDLWITLYGAEAGNLALRTLSRGGVYVAGGIAAKILPKLKEGRFVEAFAQKAALSDMLRAIPITVVLNEETPLRGAAATAAALS